MESFLLRLWDVGHNEGFLDHKGIKENLNEHQTHIFFNFCWYLCQLSALEKTKICQKLHFCLF